jgi:hypothetical protein
LQGQFLRYYKKENDSMDKELGCVQLSKVINLWVNVGDNVDPPRPSFAGNVFVLDVMQSSGIPRAFVVCGLTIDSKMQWVAALQAAIEVYRGEVSAPVSMSQGLHIQQNAPLEEIMQQLAAANSTSSSSSSAAGSSPGRSRAATSPRATGVCRISFCLFVFVIYLMIFQKQTFRFRPLALWFLFLFLRVSAATLQLLQQ